MKVKSLPPFAPTLIESTRAIGYTLEAAIADIIDNSISASASSVDIFFFPDDASFIAILDDGCGMNPEELEKAMRYGSQSPNQKRDAMDLGRFGLGLKTASLSQCRILTVASKQKERIEARRWDVDHVIATKDWSLLILDSEKELNEIPKIEELRKLETGTLVVWQNLDRLIIGQKDFIRFLTRKMDDVRSHLSLIFHRFIKGEVGIKNNLMIRVNNVPIQAADPFLSQMNTQIIAEEVLFIDGARVTVRPYILPHISSLTNKQINELGGKEGLRKSQGFYIYRNRRLLVWGTWFRMMPKNELSKLARVQVDIPNVLDDLWTLDVKKSSANPPEEVKVNLEKMIERLAEHSKQTWVFRGKKETRDNVTHVWERLQSRSGGLFYAVNRGHPLVKIFDEAPQQIKQNLEYLLREIERCLPLSSLYIDLTSDRRVEPDVEPAEQEIEELLQNLLSQIKTNAAQSELIERLVFSEPFINYPSLVKKYWKGDRCK